jgi:hypothetical protein
VDRGGERELRARVGQDRIAAINFVEGAGAQLRFFALLIPAGVVRWVIGTGRGVWLLRRRSASPPMLESSALQMLRPWQMTSRSG